MSCVVDLHEYWDGTEDEYSDRPEVLFLDDHIGFLDSCPKIVDLGCGVGNVMAQLRDGGHHVFGITYQPKEAAAAQEKHGLTVQVGDIHQLPWADESFDGFILWDVLEHCIAPLVALKEARRVLKTGGKGLIFIPGRPWQSASYHIIVPTIRQMIHLLRLAALEIDDLIDYSNYENNFGLQTDMAVYRVHK